MEATLKLAEFAAKVSYADMPGEVIAKGKERFLDTLGCILAGGKDETAKIILRFIEDLGGRPESRIIGFSHKTSAPHAALANGTIGHALDYDDSQLSLIGHPSVVILPAVLSIGEREKASGKKVLEAFQVGVEVACKVGRGVNPKLYNNGWHATGVVGILGAAVAVGKLLGLDVDQMTTAIGLAASQACGLRENFGTMTKPFHAGKAAEGGVISALLVKNGFTAAKNILEAKRGFCNAFSGEYDLAKMVKNLGNPYEIISPGVHTKPYPSCLATHSMIEAAISLAQEQNINPEEIVSVECGVDPLAMEVLIHDHPKTSLEGKFSAQFVTAISFSDRKASLDLFKDEKVQDPKTVALMEKIRMVLHPNLEKVYIPSSTIVTVRLKNNRDFTKRVDIAKGNPENPLSEKEIIAKFQGCAESVISKERVDQSIQTILNLDKIADINQLMDLVSLPKSK